MHETELEWLRQNDPREWGLYFLRPKTNLTACEREALERRRQEEIRAMTEEWDQREILAHGKVLTECLWKF